tara:strand:- start:38 stop:835 length:798 start_codon:yes stop_codon:yes gene_type:complete
MDLNAIRSKLNSLQQTNKGDGNNSKSLFWKPSIGKQTVRIVPNKFNKSNPFTEVYFHYGIGERTMISPINFDEKDPIVEFAKQLRTTSDKENWRLAKKLDPKMRVFVPVVVRGEEDQGVKLWQFGKNTYLEFLSLADDEDIGDYTDIHQGRDITVDTVGPDVTGTAYNKSSVRVKTKQTPLGEPDQIQKWLEDQANPTEVFKRHSFEDMKSNLQTFLAPEEEAGSTTNEGSSSDLPFDKGGSQNNYAVKAPLKETKVDKFDELFS